MKNHIFALSVAEKHIFKADKFRFGTEVFVVFAEVVVFLFFVFLHLYHGGFLYLFVGLKCHYVIKQ